jgi:hypothetical protein
MRVGRGFFLSICIIVYLTISTNSVIAQSSLDNREIKNIIDGHEKLESSFYYEFSESDDIELGLFYTISSSNGSDAVHIHVPFILRFVKSTGLGIILVVLYSSDDAETIIADRSGNIVNQVKGPHMLLYHGFGMFGYNGSAFTSPVWLVGVSIRPPRILFQ